MKRELILEALAYRRHVGATLGDIRSYMGVRERTKHSLRDDLVVLRGLQETGRLVKVGKKWFLTPAGQREARGSALEARWRDDDAWVLLAMLYNDRSEKAGSRLTDIIATADYINHAILSREELHGALNRLLAGRLVVRNQDRFKVAETALALFGKVETASGRFVHDQLDALQRILRCPCCGVRLKAVRWRIDLDEPTFKAAVDAYLERAR